MYLILTHTVANQRNAEEAMKRGYNSEDARWWESQKNDTYTALNVGDGVGLEEWELSLCEEITIEDIDLETSSFDGYEPARYSLSELSGRYGIFIAMKEAADGTALEIPQDAFFKEHKEVFDFWLTHGGGGLRNLFENADEVWLDMRVDQESPTPREFALNLPI